MQGKLIKIGIITDIHSNIAALKSIWQEFERRDVEYVICLGDTVGLGARPEECVQFLRAHQKQLLACVRGNHENYLLEALPVHNHGDATKSVLPKEILDLFRWNHNQISDESIDYLRQFPKETSIKIGGHTIFVSHYPVDATGQYKTFFFTPTIDECREIFADKPGDIFLFGHTHLREYHRGRDGKIFINPGAAGCPIGTDSASAGILSLSQTQVDYEQLDIDYDIETAIEDMLQHTETVPAIDYTVDQFYRKH